jgi:hypothetical protein
MDKNTYKVGDIVRFGAYGYFDEDKPYTIIRIEDTLPMFGDVKYILSHDGEREVVAYADEIQPYES